MKVIIPIVYRFNSKYAIIIEKIITDLHLPANYISLHIRAGDKISERKLISPQEYLNKAIQNSSCKDVFVATDDFRIFEQLRDNNPAYNFFTLTSPSEKGYDNDTFIASSNEFIRQNLLELFASIQIILKSELFVGTYSSNPGMFVGMLIDDKMIGMDFDKWLII